MGRNRFVPAFQSPSGTGLASKRIGIGLYTQCASDHDDNLRSDLRALRKEVTTSGNIRFAGESEQSHCDRTWAKALRQHAARHRPTIGARVGY